MARTRRARQPSKKHKPQFVNPSFWSTVWAFLPAAARSPKEVHIPILEAPPVRLAAIQGPAVPSGFRSPVSREFRYPVSPAVGRVFPGGVRHFPQRRRLNDEAAREHRLAKTP